MNILVVGGGCLGRSIAEVLDRKGHEVSVIEESEYKLSLFDADFGGLKFQAFPMDINNLINAGIESCDAVLVTSSDDNLNITIGQIAKNIFGKENVISRISDPFRESIFENFGLKTVCPTNMATECMIKAIFTPLDVSQKLYFGTSNITFESVKAEKRMIGRSLIDIVNENNELAFGLQSKDGNFKMCTALNCPIVSEGDMIIYAIRVD